MNEGLQVRRSRFFDKNMNVVNVIVVVAITLLFGVGIGASVEPLRQLANNMLIKQSAGQLTDENFNLYWEVYNKLQQYYVDPKALEADKLYKGSIKGMVEALGDAPTVYFTAEETKNYEQAKTGSYSGIGAELDYVNKSVVVVAPFEGAPADLAGIQPRDVIAKVNGVAVGNKSLTEVVMEIRGEAGTKVALTVLRPRENYKEYVLEITRGNVNAPSMRMVENKDGIAVVKISRFTDATLETWVKNWNGIVNELEPGITNGTTKGLIIDLRNNPGGYFDAAIVLASDFLPKGTVVSYQREKGDSDTSFPTTYEPRLKDIPVVVLVNGSSASASEIFAGAMKHYERATIVGEKTYGKGTAQIILPVSDGSSLHVTVSRWLLPDKNWINPENPVKPNDEIVYDFDLGDKGGDNQLNRAKELLSK